MGRLLSGRRCLGESEVILDERFGGEEGEGPGVGIDKDIGLQMFVRARG